ncbi:MAG: sigma-70 family RNA polymerase sigma factor [Planctomycetes bacterium]|nr:sigma-70 family RNA polymerase sigma factor [Planctomycetota bacterium]
MPPESDAQDPDERTLTRAELDELVERHLDVLRYYVRLRAGPLVRARESIDDVVQSTVRELYEQRATVRYSGEAAFRRYLYTVATHKIISKNRHHQALRRSPEREALLSDGLWDLPQPGGSRPSRSPSAHAERSDELDRLRAAFDTLSEDDRQILAMRKVFDMPTREIATQLSIPESTVRWRLSVILAELASRMG